MLLIRRTIQKALAAFRYTLVAVDKFDVTFKTPPLPPPTLDLMVSVVHHLSSSGTLPYLVQIGACDGVVLDPVHHVITTFGLPSLLVEPVPATAEALRRNYAGFPHVSFAECAIADDGATVRMYCVKSLDSHGGWGMHWSSSDATHLIRLGVSPEDIVEIVVPAMTLASLFSEHAITRCDILQIDTEGSDDRIVDMALALPHPPSVVQFEHIHLGYDRKRRILERLTASGYKWAEVGWNTLAIRE